MSLPLLEQKEGGYSVMGRNVKESDNPQIDFSTISNIKNFIPVYHGDEDTFFLRPDKPRPAVSFDWDGDVWLRIDPENGEIVGIEIDDFESIFSKKYPELANAWKEVKPLCHRKKIQKVEETLREAFLRIILEFLLAFLRDKPQQANLDVISAV